MAFASEIDGNLIIPAYWQSAWNAMYNVMTIVGSVIAGYVQDWLGRRAVFLLAIIISTAGIAANFVANNPAQFLAGKIVTGLSIGMFLAVTQTYVSEISPLPMRGIALSVNTIMLVSCASCQNSLRFPSELTS
jgi:MFS transporter, SP family, general alpha glucoside:H+ symporter